MAAARVAVVVGVGPGLGLAVSRRFAQGGFHVAMMARDKAKLEAAAKELQEQGFKASGISCDASSEESVAAAFAEAKAIGNIQVLVFNAAGGFKFPPPKFAETSLEQLQGSLQINCVGAFVVSQQVVPDMLTRGEGTIIFTGATASVRGSAGFGPFAAGKFALRALSQSMARELHPQGIHVAHVIIDGIIATPRIKQMMPNKPEETLVSPDGIAQTYWDLHSQPKSCWTVELDVRTNLEKF